MTATPMRMWLVIAALLIPAVGLAQGPAGSIVTDKQPKTIPAVPKPDYLVPMVDPVFGAKVTRISGDAGTPIPNIGGTWAKEVRHHYSKDQAWNADMSLLILTRHRGRPNPLYLDGRTYEPLFTIRPPGDARWHPDNPDLMQYVTGNRIGRFNVRTGADEVVATIDGYTDFRPLSEGNFSNDGDWVAVTATDPDGRTVAFAYDLAGTVKHPDIDLSGMASIDWAGISPLGRFIVVSGSHNERNHRGGLDQTRVFNVRGEPVGRIWEDYGEPSHYDLAVDAFGEEVAVGVAKSGDHAGTLISRRLRDGKFTPVNPEYASHTSARNSRRPGWAYATCGDDRDVYRNEIIAVKLDGSMLVERLCHMHLVHVGYATEGHASVSLDGNRVIFNSNWDDPEGDVSVYVADVRHLESTDRPPPGR